MDSLRLNWPADERLLQLQHVFDVLIAMAYFGIPLAVIYFQNTAILPHKQTFLYFGMVATVCGPNFMSNIWKHYQGPSTTNLAIAIVKSCATAVLWLTVVSIIIPNLLILKKREHLLKKRIEELSGERSLMLRQAEIWRSFIKLTHEILSTIDCQCVVKSAIVGLVKVLDLDQCALWFPLQNNTTLCLCDAFNSSVPVGSTIQMSHPVVAEILDSMEPVRIPHNCPLVWVPSIDDRCMATEVVAVRIPILNFPFIESHNWQNTSAKSYAVMVLGLPSDSVRKLCDYELELVKGISEQLARKDMKKAFCDSMVSLLMSLDAMPILLSSLLETTLTTQQRAMLEAALKIIGNVRLHLVSDLKSVQ